MDIHPIPPKLWGSLEDRKPTDKTPKIPSEPGKSWDVTLVPSSFLTQYSFRISGTENYTTTTPRQKSEFLKLELSRKGSSQGPEWSSSFSPGGYLGRGAQRERGPIQDVPFHMIQFFYWRETTCGLPVLWKTGFFIGAIRKNYTKFAFLWWF